MNTGEEALKQDVEAMNTEALKQTFKYIHIYKVSGRSV